LSELQAYVKQQHTTGVSWNSTRKSNKFDASRVGKSSSSKPVQNGHAAAASSVAGPPPPPPPPMPNFNDLLSEESAGSKPKTDLSNEALFAQLNKGADITKHLKQVRDDQKTHKNPNLRAGALVPSSATSSTSVATSTTSKTSVIKKPSVCELVDKKWKVEYQQNKHDLLIDDTDLKQTVYIYQCKDCTITVKGKVNSILLDSCTKVGLLFDDVLSTIEFINCKSVQMQVMGKVPTVAIEKTDGCQVYLSQASLHTEIVSSKSSSMNVLIPDENNDYTELPLPEQFKTVINPTTKKLSTNPTEIV
jgi:adenylyl cyclase-associated protein